MLCGPGKPQQIKALRRSQRIADKQIKMSARLMSESRLITEEATYVYARKRENVKKTTSLLTPTVRQGDKIICESEIHSPTDILSKNTKDTKTCSKVNDHFSSTQKCNPKSICKKRRITKKEYKKKLTENIDDIERPLKTENLKIHALQNSSPGESSLIAQHVQVRLKAKSTLTDIGFPEKLIKRTTKDRSKHQITAITNNKRNPEKSLNSKFKSTEEKYTFTCSRNLPYNIRKKKELKMLENETIPSLPILKNKSKTVKENDQIIHGTNELPALSCERKCLLQGCKNNETNKYKKRNVSQKMEEIKMVEFKLSTCNDKSLNIDKMDSVSVCHSKKQLNNVSNIEYIEPSLNLAKIYNEPHKFKSKKYIYEFNDIDENPKAYDLDYIKSINQTEGGTLNTNQHDSEINQDIENLAFTKLIQTDTERHENISSSIQIIIDSTTEEKYALKAQTRKLTNIEKSTATCHGIENTNLTTNATLKPLSMKLNENANLKRKLENLRKTINLTEIDLQEANYHDINKLKRKQNTPSEEEPKTSVPMLQFAIAPTAKREIYDKPPINWNSITTPPNQYWNMHCRSSWLYPTSTENLYRPRAIYPIYRKKMQDKECNVRMPYYDNCSMVSRTAYLPSKFIYPLDPIMNTKILNSSSMYTNKNYCFLTSFSRDSVNKFESLDTSSANEGQVPYCQIERNNSNSKPTFSNNIRNINCIETQNFPKRINNETPPMEFIQGLDDITIQESELFDDINPGMLKEYLIDGAISTFNQEQSNDSLILKNNYFEDVQILMNFKGKENIQGENTSRSPSPPDAQENSSESTSDNSPKSDLQISDIPSITVQRINDRLEDILSGNQSTDDLYRMLPENEGIDFSP